MIDPSAIRGCSLRAPASAMASRTGSPASKHVLITGASGFVGGICRQYWGHDYRLRLADVRSLSESTDEHHELIDRSALAPNESFWLLDCSDYDKVLAACQGVDVVLHLAADPNGAAEFDSLLPRNIIAGMSEFLLDCSWWGCQCAKSCSESVVAQRIMFSMQLQQRVVSALCLPLLCR